VKRASREGMTLIEIMVAIAILAMVTSVLYSGFVQTASNKKRVETQLDRHHEIRMGIERIARELTMAFTSTHRNVNPTLQPVITAFIAKEDGNGTRIDFTSFSHRRLYRDAHESDQNELGYFVVDHPDGGREVLARREQRRIDDDPETGGQIQILIDDVSKFELSFFNPETSMWQSTWDTTQASGQPNRLPTQVKIFVTVPNLSGKGPEQTFGTRTQLPITYALNHATYRGAQ